MRKLKIAMFLVMAVVIPAVATAQSTITGVVRVPKLRIYSRERVSLVWLINPRTHTLEVFRLNHGAWVLMVTHDGDASVTVEPFHAVPLDLFRLWGRTAPEA